MGLRRRLLLVFLGSGLALAALIAAGRELLLRRATTLMLADALEARLDALGRERCEEGFAGHGPDGGRHGRMGSGGPPWGPGAGFGGPHGPARAPLEVAFYGRDFTPRWHVSPPLPAAARDALSRGEAFVLVPGPAGRPGFLGARPTGWDSERCAFVAGFLAGPPVFVSAGPFALVSAGLLLALGAVVYLAAGPPVRRIRALSEAVRASAARHYVGDVPVQGRDEIAELARAFDAASAAVRSHVEDVETRERALRDFVANTTHDVGLPLSVLAGHLAEMRDRLGRGAPIEAAQVASATQEAQYIASLLQNLAAAAQLDTESALRERHPVDLGALVERVAVRHRGVARDKGVELNHSVPESPATVSGDVTLLEQAVSNLVHNAVRYNRAGGHVALVLDVPADGRSFALRVSDDGPGVPDADLERLGRERFRGGDARSRHPEGLGLGLAIAGDVARRHGFALRFRRSEAGGLEAELSGPASN